MTEDELYSKFLSGDTSAYDELIIRLSDSITVYINGYLHDIYEAENLMIETFAKIMFKKPTIKKGSFKSYLYKTARNLTINFHRSFDREKLFSLESIAEELADEEQLEEGILNTERKKSLHKCLARIEPKLREVLWLIYFEDMSYAEAAEVMKMNVKKIDNLLVKGKEHMRRELKKEGITNAYE